jgi:SAM-dependent methyltransferase
MALETTPPPTPRPGDPWSRYWARGALHSCPNAFAGNYSDELRAVWDAFFADLPEGARILDAGTGNGAIAFIAQEAAATRQRTFEIHAIDAATIDPARAAAGAGLDAGAIHFRGEVPLENAPFEAGSFDAVTGQYALEYVEPEAAAAAVRRLLKAGGRALFVVHHAKSAAVAAARL